MKLFFKYLIWIIRGKPYFTYPGYHCGCCGKWVSHKYKVPEYISLGEWHDTWGICDECGDA